MTDQTFFISREELAATFRSPRAVKQFEEMQRRVAETEQRTTAGVGATETLGQATFVTLSPNAELAGEFVLSVGAGLRLVAGEGAVTLYSDAPRVSGGHGLTFVVAGPSEVVMPLGGILATRENAETLKNKTLEAPKFSGIGNYVDDAAAAAGGVPIGGAYRNGSVFMIRTA